MKLLIISGRHGGTRGGNLERLRAVVPDVEFIVAKSKEEAIEKITDVDAVYAGPWLERDILLAASEKLRWVQISSAGVDATLYPEMVESDVILTNASGAYDIPIAEHVFSMILCFSRGLNTFIRRQLAGVWRVEGVWRRTFLMQLAGQTILIIGLGSIGLAVAQRAHGFEMRILAIDPMAVEKPDYVERVEKPDKLHELLSEADFITICCPLTKTTFKMIGEAEFQKMKPSAHIINIARGKIIDEAALIRALQEKRIAGAGLDVFEQEPLPPDSPLWQMPNVIITPHSAGASPPTGERTFQIFCENLGRFVAGEPLINVVDKGAGF
ncbi:TPA: D-2-hydroxyacid dehydrogenase [Candidatus Poribacteria bacterium]|nr:D-2-hydroxyacid dehydrogenase [Candidatus Poribacteria bacterium]